MHHVQFDVTTGEALNNPIPEYIDEPLPGKWAQTLRHFGALIDQTSICNIHTFGVIVEGDAIQVEVV